MKKTKRVASKPKETHGKGQHLQAYADVKRPFQRVKKGKKS